MMEGVGMPCLNCGNLGPAGAVRICVFTNGEARPGTRKLFALCWILKKIHMHIAAGCGKSAHIMHVAGRCIV